MLKHGDLQRQQAFYVTGMPRSRTAWLSVALSDWTNSACLHEPLAKITYGRPASVHPIDGDVIPSSEGVDAVELKSLLEATRCNFAGISDSGLPVVASDLPTLLPGPILIVWREPDDVIDSLTAYLGGDRDVHAGGVALMHAALSTFASSHDCMVVDFEQLSEMDTMRKIWGHLLPGLQFQRRRIESLQRLRIDPDPATLLDGVSESASAKVKSVLQVEES